MATSRLDFKLVQRGWLDDLDGLIEALNKGEPIFTGGLTVSGHSYWVILEYGSSPRTKGAGPKPGDVVALTLPPGTPRGKGYSRYYPIRPRKANRLVFFHNGRTQVRKEVRHPGNIERGFIRRAIYKAEQQLLADLYNILNSGDMPKRSELIRILNKSLLNILKGVVDATPEQDVLDKHGFIMDDDDEGISHLRDAWGVILAQ